jgi:hypothetical protein
MMAARQLEEPIVVHGPVFDPVLSIEASAKYLGDISTRTLRRLNLARAPIPGTGQKRARYGYRLSVLEAYLARLENPKARTPLVRASTFTPNVPRARGRFARRNR